MKTYQVSWIIEVDADDVCKAAQKALKIQRDPDSIATCFKVAEPLWGPIAKTHWIDLSKETTC